MHPYLTADPLCNIGYEAFSIGYDVVFGESIELYFGLLHILEPVNPLHEPHENDLVIDLRVNFNHQLNLLKEEISTCPKKLPLNFYNSRYCSLEVPLNKPIMNFGYRPGN